MADMNSPWIPKEKGWTSEDYTFDEVYDIGFNVEFVYQGTEYKLSAEKDEAMYNAETGEIVSKYHGKDGFYSLVVFGRTIREVIADAYIMGLS